MFHAKMYAPLRKGMIFLQKCHWQFFIQYFVADFLTAMQFLLRKAAMLPWSWDRNSVCPSVTRVLNKMAQKCNFVI